MDAREAERLIAAAVPAQPGTWADFGAGDGTFTRPLAARLGPGSRVYAVDHDQHSVRALRRLKVQGVEIVALGADLASDFQLPGVGPGTLEGWLLANTLHFMRDADAVLTTLATLLRPDGVAVLIEYDGRRPSQWVPYPIGVADLDSLFEAAMLTAPRVVARTESMYGGELYVAVARKA